MQINFMKPPKKWKMAVIIWIAIYPSITSVFLFGGKYLMLIDSIPLRTLCVTVVLVPLMVFVLIPLLQKLFKNWLFK